MPPPDGAVPHAEPALDERQQKLVATLREWLQPTNFLSPGSEYAKHVRAYIPGTGGWIRKSPEFLRWRSGANFDTDGHQHDGNDIGCLWVKGVPGSGKSVLSASIVQLLQDTEPKTPVLFFFFRQIVKRNHDPKYLVRDFASQLLPYSSNLRTELRELSKTGRIEPIERSNKLWTALLRALNEMDKVYCVADALDEMDNDHHDFIGTLRDVGLKSPQKLKLLLTSRPVPSIEAVLRSHGIAEIKLKTSLLYPDIVKYAKTRLGSLVPRLSPEKEELVKDTICQRTSGLFLHARILIDNLTESLSSDKVTEETLPDSLDRLPSSLKGVYEEMLIEHAARSSVSRDQQVRILSCVVNASRPLRVIELGSLIAQMRDEPTELRKGKALVREGCGRLLEILEDESVSVIHHSFTEFLRDTDRALTPNAFPVLDSKRSHRELAVACLEYLDAIPLKKRLDRDTDIKTARNRKGDCDLDLESASGYDESPSDDERQEQDRKEQVIADLRVERPLMEYALGNWAHHVKNAEEDDPAVLKALIKFMKPNQAAFELCAKVGGLKDFDDSVTKPIHLASHFGLVSFAKHLLNKQPSAKNATGGQRCTPLAIAAREGQTAIAELLLSRGAEPDCVDSTGMRPLHYCASHGRTEIAKLLLQNGVDPNTVTTDHTYYVSDLGPFQTGSKTALELACSGRNNGGVFEVLLPYLRPEDATHCLHSVLDAEKLEAILKTGQASIDSFCNGRTALFGAAASHRNESIDLLLRYGADPNKRSSRDRDWATGTEKYTEDGEGTARHPDGPTPLHAFVGYSDGFVFRNYREEADREILQLLLKAGADINATCCSNGWRCMDNDITPLHLAVLGHQSSWGDGQSSGEMARSAELITSLLLKNGADVNALTRESNSPAHLATTGSPGLVTLLFHAGADYKARNDKGMTPLLKGLSDTSEREFPLATLDSLLAAGSDATAVDKDGTGCMHYLMRNLNTKGKDYSLRFCQTLVEAGASLNEKNGREMPPLHFYIHMMATPATPRNETLLRELINDGLDINMQDSSGRNVLFKAMDAYGGVELGEMFIRLGVDVNAKTKYGETPLHRAVHMDNPLQWIRMLVEAGADFTVAHPEGDSLIQLVPQHVNGDEVAEIVDYLVELGMQNSYTNSKGQTQLHLTSLIDDNPMHWEESNDHPLIRMLRDYREKQLTVDECDDQGATALHYACSTDEVNAGRLLKAGADPTCLTKHGESPLHIAAAAQQSNIVGLLLSEYKKRGVLDQFLDLSDATSPGRTALHYACRSGRTGSVHYLVSYGANVNAVDAGGLTPLQACLEFPEESPMEPRGRRDHERIADIVSILADAGGNLGKTVDVDGIQLTVLDMALKEGFREMVLSLIDHGVSCHDENAIVRIVNQAELDEDVELVMKISNGEKIPIREAARPVFKTVPGEVSRLLGQGKYDAIKELARRRVDALAPDEYSDTTTVHILATGGYEALLRLFREDALKLRNSAWLKEEANPGTLLGTVCRSEMPNLPMIKLLVEDFGMDVNEVSNPRGYIYKLGHATPLHVLASGNHWWQIEALEYVLGKGGDIGAKNDYGQTPLMAAISNQYPDGYWKEETVEVLLRHGSLANAFKDPDTLNTCLAGATNAAIVKMLLQYGADASSPLASDRLGCAIESLDQELVKVWIEAGQNVNVRSGVRYPLHEAARRPKDDGLPQDWTVERIGIVVLLLEKDADPFLSYPNGMTILQAVIEKHGIVDPFFDIPGLDTEKRGAGGRTLLISASVPTMPPFEFYTRYSSNPQPTASSKSHAIMRLLEMGADVDALDCEGRTALHWFCTMGEDFSGEDKTAFNALLQRNTSLIHVKDANGAKPIHLALQSGQTWAVETLIEAGADITEADGHGNNALHHYAPKLLGEKTRAAAAAETFKRFLSLGVDLEARNSVGETPLFAFIVSGWEPSKVYISVSDTSYHTTHLPIFAEAGANVTTRNNKGETLLHIVAGRHIKQEWRNQELVHDATDTFKALLELGADPRIEDDKMRTAIDCAVARNRHDITNLFRGEGKKVELDDVSDDNDDDDSEPGYEMVDDSVYSASDDE